MAFENMPGGVPYQLDGWDSSTDYRSFGLGITVAKFLEVSDLLLERPNLNSTHLFRADILHDSTGRLQTIAQKEQAHQKQLATSTEDEEARREVLPVRIRNATATTSDSMFEAGSDGFDALKPYSIPGFRPTRTVVRKLIPRKPHLDRPIQQSCFMYVGDKTLLAEPSVIVAYFPHVVPPDTMPWYHPQVRALAYRYDPSVNNGTLTVYHKPFPDHVGPMPDRTHRTLLALTQTFVRLCKMDKPSTGAVQDRNSPVSTRPVAPANLKDTIIPQHVVQDTYTRLKQTYASDLSARWVEKTDPSKHVFEDIAIAAFLIELWKTMYPDGHFPGFVDIACGNGVLVYILFKEGYAGRGFDARRRKTWEVLDIGDLLEEALCIPRPFLEVLTTREIKDVFGDLNVFDGTFEPGTFIVSNHADELTLWTPILAALSHPDQNQQQQYLPFLAIPCCSHALSGARHRYTLKEIDANTRDSKSTTSSHKSDSDSNSHQNPASGDLKALRAERTKAATHTADDKSTYACLTKKTVAVAEELGFDTELTLLRIPSTRNIGVVGNRRLRGCVSDDGETTSVEERVITVLGRECAGEDGGVEGAARTWMERARKLVGGPGRGKVNWKGVVGGKSAVGVGAGVEQSDEMSVDGS